MGQPLGARVGWGMLAVATSMLDLLLLHLSYHQLGWRQHSWLSCDLRRRHAAEQQQLRQSLNTFNTYSCSCGHILVLSLVNGLVLALVPDSTAGTSTGGAATGADSPPAQSSPPQLLEARIGVLVSASLTVLPLLWLVLAHCAVRCRSQALEVLATATLFGAGIPPCAGLYFVFSPTYAWPQHLIVRLLLLAAPMAVWLLLLPAIWSAFRAVMALLRCVCLLDCGTRHGVCGFQALACVQQQSAVPSPPQPHHPTQHAHRQSSEVHAAVSCLWTLEWWADAACVLHFAANCRQPWALEALTKNAAVLAAAADDEGPQEIPKALKPLMQGAWLVSAVAAFAAAAAAAKLLS